MPDESPSNNEPEGSENGRQWTSAEIFAFPGFLNGKRNEGALQPAEHYHERSHADKFPHRSWRYDTTLRSQFRRIRDDWRIFKEISDASGTDRGSMPNASYDGRAAKIIDSGLLTNDFIAIDTYAIIFSDEPDAGRMILPARDADDDKISDLDEPDFIGSTTGPSATPTSTATLVSDASELGAESCVVCPRPLRKLIGHEFARLFEELEP
ncbi:hypothetical protein E4U52_003274 [Claviceps spartinae]|nr:hypothetical protein E4U52_003274 [Claviceps spartinae]